MKSTVYLTGAGPGDTKLITVRALELIKKADCIIYDYLANPELLKFAPTGCELIYVGKSAGSHTLPQEKINRLLAEKASVYKTVVRLKGGDPFIFGRGAEEALYLKTKGINFEVVPGVTSAIAAPAYAGIPLTLRNKNSTVGFITGHEDPSKEKSSLDWAALSKGLGTMVFLMGAANLELIARKLIAAGRPKDTKVAVIMQGSTARQKTVTGQLSDIASLARKSKITAPAIIVVGDVVALRKQLGWFEKRLLFGKRVVVTRTREQAGALSSRLMDLGAEVIEAPVIKIKPLNADKKALGAFSRDKYGWVFFTSANGVREFSSILCRTGKDSRIFAGSKVCAIGSETADALSAIGIKADYVPSEFTAEAIVRHFKNYASENKKALILRAKEGRDVMPDGLRKAGFSVRVIDLYRTICRKETAVILKEVFKAGVDIITFTSSSTVKNFIALLGKNYKRFLCGVKLASIGPVTSQTLRKFGLRPAIQAKVYTIEGLIKAIVKND